MPFLYAILFSTDCLRILYLCSNRTAWPKILTANFEHDSSIQLLPPGLQNTGHWRRQRAMTPVTQYQQTKQVTRCNLVMPTVNLAICVCVTLKTSWCVLIRTAQRMTCREVWFRVSLDAWEIFFTPLSGMEEIAMLGNLEKLHRFFLKRKRKKKKGKSWTW